MSEQTENIVVILRDCAKIPLYCHVPLNAAADEIERLRAANWIEDQIAAEAAFEESGCKRDWPDDEPDTIQRITQCMAREILRLRSQASKPTQRKRQPVAWELVDNCSGEVLFRSANRVLVAGWRRVIGATVVPVYATRK